MKFKKGDKVIVNATSCWAHDGCLPIGSVHTVHHVISVSEDRQAFVYLEVEEPNVPGRTGGWFPERFDLCKAVTAPKIKSGTQLDRVRDIALQHPCQTLEFISRNTGASEAGVSARLRDLRALGYTVDCKKVPGSKQRLYTVSGSPA